MTNTVTYYVCVVNDQYKGPKENIGKLLGDYDYVSAPKWACFYTDRAVAERRAAGKPHLSVVPLTMIW